MQAVSDITCVINRMALIENLLNQIILRHFEPREESATLFWDVLLDGSVIGFAGKAKVALAISQELNFELDKNALHDMMKYRNAFAHHQVNSHPCIRVSEPPDKNISEYTVRILSSSGKWELKSRKDALSKFNRTFDRAKTELLQFLENLK